MGDETSGEESRMPQLRSTSKNNSINIMVLLNLRNYIIFFKNSQVRLL